MSKKVEMFVGILSMIIIMSIFAYYGSAMIYADIKNTDNTTNDNQFTITMKFEARIIAGVYPNVDPREFSAEISYDLRPLFPDKTISKHLIKQVELDFETHESGIFKVAIEWRTKELPQNTKGTEIFYIDLLRSYAAGTIKIHFKVSAGGGIYTELRTHTLTIKGEVYFEGSNEDNEYDNIVNETQPETVIGGIGGGNGIIITHPSITMIFPTIASWEILQVTRDIVSIIVNFLTAILLVFTIKEVKRRHESKTSRS